MNSLVKPQRTKNMIKDAIINRILNYNKIQSQITNDPLACKVAEAYCKGTMEGLHEGKLLHQHEARMAFVRKAIGMSIVHISILEMEI